MLAFEIILRTLLPFRSLFSAFFSSFPPLSLILQRSSGSILGDTPIYLSLVPNPIPPHAHRIINLTKAVYWFIDFSVWLCHLSVPKLPTVCRIKFNFLGLELKACYHLALPSCHASPFFLFNTNLPPRNPPTLSLPPFWTLRLCSSSPDTLLIPHSFMPTQAIPTLYDLVHILSHLKGMSARSKEQPSCPPHTLPPASSL